MSTLLLTTLLLGKNGVRKAVAARGRVGAIVDGLRVFGEGSAGARPIVDRSAVAIAVAALVPLDERPLARVVLSIGGVLHEDPYPRHQFVLDAPLIDSALISFTVETRLDQDPDPKPATSSTDAETEAAAEDEYEDYNDRDRAPTGGPALVVNVSLRFGALAKN